MDDGARGSRTIALRNGVGAWRSFGPWILVAALASAVLWTGFFPAPTANHFRTGDWLAIVAIAVFAMWLIRARIDAVRLQVVMALSAMVVTDAGIIATLGLRDLTLYLRAGERFASGGRVYLSEVTFGGSDLTGLPFLYPPPTLPIAALLSALPDWLVGGLWVAASVAALLIALRLFGLPWRFAVLFLAWPPVFEGLWVGNVASFLLLFFAVTPWLGAGLVLFS